MVASAAVNVLHNHVIISRGVANKDQSAADAAAAAEAAAAAAAAAAQEKEMAEAAALARKVGLETSLDTEPHPQQQQPPQVAAAPGALETFGLTVSVPCDV